MSIFDRLIRAVEIVCAVLFCVMGLSLFVQVVLRYFFGAALFWAEELARYSMVWLVFLGAVVGVYRNAHTRIDVLVMKLPVNIRWILEAGVALVCGLFMGVISYQGYRILKVAMMSKSTALGIPMGYVYGVVLVTGIPMSFFLLRRFFLIVKNRRLDEGVR